MGAFVRVRPKRHEADQCKGELC